jgi:RNA polymerase sigma factor (sigma-70 family)
MSIETLNDQELVTLYINGKEEALETLVHRHKSRIFTSILMVIRDRSQAEDIFQETFFKVIQTLKKGQYNEEGKFLAWVLRIARNLIIDHFRRVRKMPSVPVYVNDEGEEVSVFDHIAAGEASPGAEMSAFRKEIRTMITSLPEEQREVVLMRMYYDMSFKEIAEFTGVSINTSLGRMRYALFNLRKMMAGRSTADVLAR